MQLSFPKDVCAPVGCLALKSKRHEFSSAYTVRNQRASALAIVCRIWMTLQRSSAYRRSSRRRLRKSEEVCTVYNNMLVAIGRP